MQIDRPIAIALIFFIILLLVFFLVSPEYKAFKKLQVELGEKKAEFNAKFDYYNTITKAFFELQSRKDDLKKVDDALPQDPDMGKIIYYLGSTAAGSGMIIENLFLSKTATANAQTITANNVKEIVFSMDLLGDYQSLGRFMAALEKSARIFEITSISFGSSAQPEMGPDETQFETQQINSFSLQIKTFSY